MRIYAIQPREIVVAAALRAGIEIVPVVGSGSVNSSVPVVHADVADPASVASGLQAHLQRLPAESALCMGPTDESCLVAAEVNRLLRWEFGGYWRLDSLTAMASKDRTRACVEFAAPDLNPRWIIADGSEELIRRASHWGSVVVKPTAGHGSRGVHVVQHLDSNALAHLADADFPLIVEEWVEGEEYSVEAISLGGAHQVLAITEKRTGGSSGVVEIRHRQPAPVTNETRHQLELAATRTLDAVGYTDGLSHTEFILRKDGSVKLIETHGRAGGDLIVDMLGWTVGRDGYEILFATLASGRIPDIHPTGMEARVYFPNLQGSKLSIGQLGQALYSKRCVREVRFLRAPDEWGEVRDSGDRHCLVLAAGEAHDLDEVEHLVAELEIASRGGA